VLLSVLLAEKYELVPLAKARDNEVPAYRPRQRKRVIENQGADSKLPALPGMERLEIQTATQQKQETSVSVLAQSP
jgi:hypothetical protein